MSEEDPRTGNVCSPEFWDNRIKASADKPDHYSVFECSTDLWESIGASHRKILGGIVKHNTSILDIGCAYGRLLDLLPSCWKGDYLGIDVSPEFINKARVNHPNYEFILGDARHENMLRIFDIAILTSIRHMINRDMGSDQWEIMYSNIKRYASSFVYLEYDVENPYGSKPYYGGNY